MLSLVIILIATLYSKVTLYIHYSYPSLWAVAIYLYTPQFLEEDAPSVTRGRTNACRISLVSRHTPLVASASCTLPVLAIRGWRTVSGELTSHPIISLLNKQILAHFVSGRQSLVLGRRRQSRQNPSRPFVSDGQTRAGCRVSMIQEQRRVDQHVTDIWTSMWTDRWKCGLAYYSIGCILTKTHMNHHTEIIFSVITFLVFLLFTNFGIDHLILFVCLCCQDGKRSHQLTDGRLRRRLMKAIVRRLCSEIWWYV